MPSSSSSSSARLRAWDAEAPVSCAASATLSSAGRSSSRLKNWKIMPIRRRRNNASPVSFSFTRSSPCTTTEPAVGRSSPATMFSSVDLPQPDGPITATASPARISNVTPSSAVESPYSLRTPSSRTTTGALPVSSAMTGILTAPVQAGHPPPDVSSPGGHPREVGHPARSMMRTTPHPGKVITVWESETNWLLVALVAACAAAGWLGTTLARERRLHRRALDGQGWLLERERESAARTAVDAERARIAQELHDIVSHNVSLMVVQAGAAREVLPTMPDQAAAALLAVEGAGRDAMTELRHLLGLLAPSQNGEDDGADLSPQPSLSRLSPLIDRIAFAGLPVDVRISGEPRPLPAGIDLTAYRIVQEALTNAIKHGDGGKAEVTVRYADHALRVEVLSSGSAPDRPQGDGAGRGLLGLRERVTVYGGDLDARRRLGGGYRVRARIPLDRP